MSELSLQLIETNKINILHRKSVNWHFTIGNESNKIITDIESFLKNNKQFTQINAQYIVNLNYLDDCSLEEPNCFLVISGNIYNVEQEFIIQVKNAHKNFLNEKYFKKNRDVENIKFLVRNGHFTEIYYKDGTKKKHYETLKFFEHKFKESNTLVRINRNYLVNIEYIESYKILSASKTGEVYLDTKTIPISRRQLVNFKKIIKINRLIVLKQKGF